MIKLICSICGVEETFRDKWEAIEKGWNFGHLRVNGKKVTFAFCKGHTDEQIFNWIKNNAIKRNIAKRRVAK